MKQTHTRYKKGFTLAELLLVVAITSTLTIAGLMAYSNVYERSNAIKIAHDFQEIKAGWEAYLADTDGVYPHEDCFGNHISSHTPSGANNVNRDAPGHDEIVLTDTDLMMNDLGKTGWNGPYLPQEPLDPWGRRYSYDQDHYVDCVVACENFPYDPNSGDALRKHAGVNIQLQWCTTEIGCFGNSVRYLRIAPFIDALIDGGDLDGSGFDDGLFRWDNPTMEAYVDPLIGGYSFLLSPYSPQAPNIFTDPACIP